ncbi:MAG TPA: ISLre2 family transposase, partial [Clostridia bacterium]|nr:ISLre2 family transposase [Clostridia bacterium]
HVSHVLSARLSSRPKGWSQEGMEQMARLRVFDFNGGDIYEYIGTKKKKEIKDDRIIKLDARIIKKHKTTSFETLDNLTILNIGKKNPASKWLKNVRGL